MPNRLDRYLLRLMVGPVVACLGLTLTAILLQRLLQIFAQFAQNGAHFGFIFDLVAAMLPIYLSLALPASFFVSVFMVVAGLSERAEIDAMLASGVSIQRMTAPFIGVGVALSFASLILFGFLQPYGRYAYQVALNAAVQAGWTGKLEPQTFVGVGRGLTVTADRVGVTGRSLRGVFIRRLTSDGREQVLTAGSGRLQASADGRSIALTVKHGMEVDLGQSGAGKVFRFDNLSIVEPLAGPRTRIRARGENLEELTLFELSHELRSASPLIPRRALAGELYGRLARSFSVPFLPLLAMPLAMASKRGARAPSLILAGILLICFHHGVQLAQSLAETGWLDPAATIGSVYLVFTGLCGWLFISGINRPGDTPLSRGLALVDGGLRRLRALFA